ncbi:MAG: anthranilate synthase component I family protein, partial [Flavobacteriaceae bacterium]|nr:anthranilate synthase component I family protein [Flavobacteriaceae bacterium]
MKSFSLYTHSKKILADTITPVSIYLKLRDKFPNSILLESSDYHTSDNSFSYICCNPIATISVKNGLISQSFPDGSSKSSAADSKSVIEEIHRFTKRFKVETDNRFKFINNGIFGYMAYDAVRYYEDIRIESKPGKIDIPDVYYAVYQNIIVINHFKNEAYIFAHCYDSESNVDEIDQLIKSRNFAAYPFSAQGDIVSNLSDDEYKEHVELAKKHCARGDVFQLVLSKKFEQSFKGDEFNVYRA